MKLPKLIFLSSLRREEAKSLTGVRSMYSFNVRCNVSDFVRDPAVASIQTIKDALEWTVYG